MKRRVYRSLDRPATFFGIKGRFLVVLAAGSAASVFLAIIVGGVTSMLLGFVVILVGVIAAYFLTTSLQSKIDEKDIWKSVVKRAYPDFYRVRNKHVRNIWQGFNMANSHFLKGGNAQ